MTLEAVVRIVDPVSKEIKVNVDLMAFQELWVSSIPKYCNKIYLLIEKISLENKGNLKINDLSIHFHLFAVLIY